MCERNLQIMKEMDRYAKGKSVIETIMAKKKPIRFDVCFTKEQKAMDIESLALSVRSSNCLYRAGLRTIGKLVDAMELSENETSKQKLLRIRNLGAKSAEEILFSVMCFQFTLLSEKDREEYVGQIVS